MMEENNIMVNKKNISQNIQAADIARKAGLKYTDAGLICEIAKNIQKNNHNNNDEGEKETFNKGLGEGEKMSVKGLVEAQKPEWKPQPPEKIDSGNTGMDVYLKELSEREVEGGEK